MITEQYVTYMLKEAGFEANLKTRYFEEEKNEWAFWDSGAKRSDYNYFDDTIACPTQALAARWLREEHDIDVMIDVYNRDYYCCNIYKNKHLMIIKNIVSSDYIEVLESGLQEAIKLIKKRNYDK